MKEGYFKARTESGTVYTIRVTREVIEVPTRGGVHRKEGMVEMRCVENGRPVVRDETDGTYTRFTLVHIVELPLVRLEETPFPDI
ncbi:MAG: hypothetical protein IJS08_12285 [Victivallales bacterium]|nr:hypothetical protein [Victivallales bacterium]